MRIAMVSTPFVEVPPRAYGGTELVIHELVEGLVAGGDEVTLFATGDSTTTGELRAFFPRAQWPPDPLTDLDHVSWAFGQVAVGGYDVVHAHSAVALALSRLLPVDLPVVYTLHHHREERSSAFYLNFPEIHYVAISHDQRRREARLPRITTIHHGLDPASYRSVEHPRDYVAFLGRISRVKGPDVAIEAARRAGVPIHVAGAVHEVDTSFYEREVAPRLTEEHVTYVGPVGLAAKVELLQHARALLAPIDWNEPFGLILVEAMLAGCPVVAFSRGSVPELVEPGLTGYTAADVDEMAELIRPGGPLDGFDRARCRRRAVERFSRECMVSKHRDLYRAAVVPPRTSSPGRGRPPRGRRTRPRSDRRPGDPARGGPS